MLILDCSVTQHQENGVLFQNGHKILEQNN